MFTLLDVYHTAARCGTISKLYGAAADSYHRDHLAAISTIQLMAADTRGESAGFGARETVNAALRGRPVPIVARTRHAVRSWT